jgi:hypothetical protein
MFKRLAITIALFLMTAGFLWLVYDQIFTGSNGLTDDIKFTQVESGFWDREEVVAECEIETDNQFCFKDTIWAEQQNEIEFDGYLIVEYTNTADVIEEVSIGTVKLENVTPGKLVIKDTTPSEIFIDPNQSTKVRYDFAFDVTDDAYESTKSSGIELKSTFTNTVGKKASEIFTIQYQN